MNKKPFLMILGLALVFEGEHVILEYSEYVKYCFVSLTSL